jgi:peroxiredoxin
VVAIAGDPIPKMAELAKKFPTITLLADANGVPVSQTWGAAAKDDDVPTPSTFVVDSAGTIRFAHFSSAGKGEWPAWEQLFAALP